MSQKAFIEYSNGIDDIYKNIEKYNPNEKCKKLIVFDDMISDMHSNAKLNPIVTELYIRGRKPNISLFFTSQYYFAVPKFISLNSMEYLLGEFQTNKNFRKWHLIFLQILSVKVLWVF